MKNLKDTALALKNALEGVSDVQVAEKILVLWEDTLIAQDFFDQDIAAMLFHVANQTTFGSPEVKEHVRQSVDSAFLSQG